MCRNSFVLYTDQKETVEQLSDEEAGKLFKAIYEYNKSNEIILNGVLKAVFMQFKVFLDKDNQKWEEQKRKRSEAGKKGMEARWNSITNDNNVITNDNNVIQTITKITDNVNVNVNDNVNINNNIKEKNIKKEKYGQYGRVKLTINEYLKLKEEFGESFIKQQIDLLDEYIESNNNKNKYSNFNLVLRKSIRENWFKNKGGSNNVFLDIMKDDYGK